MADPTSNHARPPTVQNVVSLGEPRDPDFRKIMLLWEAKRGSRSMPARSDFDPSEFKELLPHVFLLDVLSPPEGYRFRLVGEALLNFHGQPLIGRKLKGAFDPQVDSPVSQSLDAVIIGRAPIFSAGKAYWVSGKGYRDYEICYLPLSADGHHVNMILGAMKFPEMARPSKAF